MTLGLPLSTIWAFLLVLARVAGMVTFLPLPGFRSVPSTVRAVLAVALTIALFPYWPDLPNRNPQLGELVWWAFAEAGFGLTIGLAVALLMEAFQIAMQIIGLQAGYGYSLTIDPTSQADSGVLQVLLMFVTGLLFFVLGIDRELMRVLAMSLERYPAGSAAPISNMMSNGTGGGLFNNPESIIRLSSYMIGLGLRLALPIAALLLLIDVALALIGRMQQQLQLITLAFPIKMLASLVLLAVLAPVIPRLFSDASQRILGELWKGLGL